LKSQPYNPLLALLFRKPNRPKIGLNHPALVTNW
jgi:hypothetical protein